MNHLIKLSTRRGKIAGLCIALLLLLGISAERAGALAAGGQDNVRSFYATLLTTMKDGRTLGQSGRYARLSPVVDRVFDVPSMTRLAATYADRFDSYSGEQLQVTGERPYNADVIVQTKIVKSDGETTTLNYLMRQNQGSWQISDVYLDGTISQVAVQRSEFNSVLRREGVDGLVMALNRKVDLLSRGVAKAS